MWERETSCNREENLLQPVISRSHPNENQNNPLGFLPTTHFPERFCCEHLWPGKCSSDSQWGANESQKAAIYSEAIKSLRGDSQAWWFCQSRAVLRGVLWLLCHTLPKEHLLHLGCVQFLCFLTFLLLWWMAVTGEHREDGQDRSKASRQRWWWDRVGYSRFCCFSECGKGKGELVADPSLCSWGTSLHLLSQHFSSVMALVLWLRMERAAPTAQPWMLLLGSVPMAQGGLGTTSAIDGEGFRGGGGSVHHRYSMRSRISDSITQPWICASAAYMELIKLWPILVHLGSPAHSDQ